MLRMLTNWRSGLNRGGLQAPEDALDYAKNVRAQSGHITVNPANMAYGVVAGSFDGQPNNTDAYLGKAGPWVLERRQGVIYVLVQGGGSTVRHPLWSRIRGGLAPTQAEKFTALGNEAFFSLAGTPTTGVALTNQDLCMEWGMHAPYGTMERNAAHDGVMASTFGMKITAMTHGSWVLSDIRPRWRLIYGKLDSGIVKWYGSQRIRWVDWDGTNYWVGTSADLTGYTLYCIADVDPIGCVAPAAAVTLSATTGGSLTAGTYKYLVRYVSTSLGVASIPSAESSSVVVGAPNNAVSITWPGAITGQLPDLPYWIDRIEVYRATYSGSAWGPYYLVQGIALNTSPWPMKPADFTTPAKDTGWADGEALPEDAWWHEQPLQLFNVTAYQGRLVATDTRRPNRIRISSVTPGGNNAHSWPTTIVDVTSVTGAAVWAGGFIDVGGGPVIGLSPEGPATDATGSQADQILIFKGSRTYRMTGRNWDVSSGVGIATAEAFPVGCIDTRSIAVAHGQTFWMSKEHLMVCPFGSYAPSVASRAIFPDDRPALVSGARGFFWEHYYFLTFPYADYTWMLDVDAGTWTQTDQALAGVEWSDGWIVWNDAPEGSLLTLSNLSGGTGAATYDLHFSGSSSTESVSFGFRTPPLALLGGHGDIRCQKAISRVWLKVRNDSGVDQSFTLALYRNGNTQTPEVTQTLTVGHDYPYQLLLAPFAHLQGLKDFDEVAIGVSGTAPGTQLAFEAILIDYEVLTPQTSRW